MKIVIGFLTFVALGISLQALADEPVSPAPAAASASPQYLFQLSYADAETAIGQALAEKGAGGKVAAAIIGHKNGPIFSYDKPITVEIHSLNYDHGKWSANLLFKAGEQVVSAIPTAGRYEEMIEAPVLKRQVRNGDVISDNDVEMRAFPLARTRTDTVTKVGDLIGKSPERTISPGRPVREAELENPAVIKKNAQVEMHYKTDSMEISATGQALDSGAKGDVISVRNNASRKIVQAIVNDEHTVIITAPDMKLSAATTSAGVQTHDTN